MNFIYFSLHFPSVLEKKRNGCKLLTIPTAETNSFILAQESLSVTSLLQTISPAEEHPYAFLDGNEHTLIHIRVWVLRNPREYQKCHNSECGVEKM